MQDRSEHEPQGVKGSRVVLVMFAIILFIAVAGYLAFKYLLNIPAA